MPQADEDLHGDRTLSAVPRAVTGRRSPRRAALLVLACSMVLQGPPAAAQVYPDRIDVRKATCAYLLSHTGETRARMLVYLNGYLDARTGVQLWEEKAAAARIERGLAACQASPSQPALEVFTRAWKR